MKLLSILISFLLSVSAFAGDSVCVQNYLATGVNPCERGIPNFAYLYFDEDPDQVVCAKIHADSNCKNGANSFDHVYTIDHEIVCTVDFHNPPHSMSCATSPDNYDWVTAVYPD